MQSSPTCYALDEIWSLLGTRCKSSTAPYLREFRVFSAPVSCVCSLCPFRYGSSCNLVLSTGNGVNGYTLDSALGEFILTHPNVRSLSSHTLALPFPGSTYAAPRARVRSKVNFRAYHIVHSRPSLHLINARRLTLTPFTRFKSPPAARSTPSTRATPATSTRPS